VARSLTCTFPLNSRSGLELHGVEATLVKYRGRSALRLTEADQVAEGPAIAILTSTEFADGVIETAVAGDRRAGAPEAMRGFVGIAFRVAPEGAQFECFYLRPTNGRADDQLRRNHATQYISHPDYPWFKLREETPGVYESYADLVPGAWTALRIEVSGVRARLYVGGVKQPTLIVNDLKLGETRGQIALWIGEGTEAYFSRIVVRPDPASPSPSPRSSPRSRAT
jgi:hypothetical protein